jgi:hypothetical protein
MTSAPRGRLVLALVVAVIVVISAPFVGQIRGAIQAALPSAYRSIVVAVVAGGLAVAVVAALLVIRQHRLPRYLAVAGALTIGTLYAVVTSTGVPEVDAVERFHFVEYGLLTFLFYRVWVDRADLASFAMPFVAAFVTGTADEAMQWFVPLRVGELHDVLLNGVAAACGLLFAVGVHPPRGMSWAVDRTGAGMLGRAAAVAIVSGALFVDAVHLGHEVRDPEVGTFLSKSEAPMLLVAAAERAERWRVVAPLSARRLSREDRYLNEALWHVEERNVAWAANDYWTAWRENLILEKFYAPLLEFPTYATPGGARWPEAQRAAAAASEPSPRQYRSEANPYPIYLWNRAVYWVAVAVLVIVVWSVCLNLRANASTSSTAPSIT